MKLFSKTRIFTVETIDELKKAAWPTKTELTDSTIVVIVAALILGLFTSISDFALYKIVDLLTSFAS